MSEPMKVYVVAKDWGYDGYGGPEHVFSSRGLAEQCRARDSDYEIFELEVLDTLPALPDVEPVAQREPDALSVALFSRRIRQNFLHGNTILTEKPSQKGAEE